MSKLIGGIILFVIFIASIYCAFYFDESFRRLIRHLYIAFTNGKISFFSPKKEIRFASWGYVVSFGLFITTLCFLFYRQTNKQRIINVALAIFLLVASILIQSYLGSLFKLIECTACNDGTRKLHFNEINYDQIFISSLIVAIIPFAITEIRKFIRLKDLAGTKYK